MSRFIEFAIHHARTVLFLLFFILLAGSVTYYNIPKESSPDVKIPIIYVALHFEGISPEDAERLLIRPVEQKVRSIEGLKEVRATAFENGGNVVLEFKAGFDSKKALDDVRAKVDEAKADLPLDTDEPTIQEVSFSLFPVLVVYLSGEMPNRTLYKIAKNLQDRIEENVTSVLEVTLVGDREEAVEIQVDPAKIEKYGLQLQNVISLFTRNNTLISAGTLDSGSGRFPIKIPGLINDVRDILDAPVGSFQGIVVKFKDVATVARTFKDPIGYARNNGKSTVALEISKRPGENIINTIEAVKSIIQQEQKLWPSSLKVSYAQDHSKRIRDMLKDLENNIIAALLLVMVVVVYALGWNSALMVGLAVPGSFLMGIVTIAMMGNTVNIVVLFALILSVGMLVDGAIIVVEYADRKMMEGMNRLDAYKAGAKRMMWPVITTTVTIIAAFAPLLFWPGIVGQFMKYLPLTLVATLTASILMALIFIPTIGSIWGKASHMENAEEVANVTAAEKGDLSKVTGYIGWYIRLLGRALDHPGAVIGSVVALLFVIIVAFSFFGKGTQFFPSVEPDTASVQVQARGNLSVDEKDRLVKQVEERILKMPELQNVYTNTTVSANLNRKSSEIPADTIGTFTLEFVDWDHRRKAQVILDEIKELTKDIPGIRVNIEVDKPGPPTGKPIFIEVGSRMPSLIQPAVKKIRSYVDTVEGLKSIEDSRPVPALEWNIQIDRALAARYGADVMTIGTLARFISNGYRVDKFRPDDSRDEIDILLRYPLKYRNLQALKDLNIQTPFGIVPISIFTKQGFQPKLDTINRVDGMRVMNVKADTKPGFFGPAKVQEIQRWLAKQDFPDGLSIRFKGEDEDQKETGSFLLKAFLITLFMITLILVTQFDSFYSAGLVLSAIVFSSIGVLIGLMILGRPFNIVMGGIGVIALGGIIVSNNIILIDTFDHLKQDFKDIKEAILRTGAQRIRPVILTKLTMVLGLLPMAMRVNIEFTERNITYDAPSTQWWVDLSTSIVFGVIFAAGLTLIVTPCALMLKHNVKLWWDGRLGREKSVV